MTIAAQIGRSVIRIGSTGPQVKAVQDGLARLGFPLHGTGYFGNATDTAVTEFQKRAGLTADGEVGQLTAAALDKAIAPAASNDQLVMKVPLKAEIGRPLWLQAGISLIGTKEFAGTRDNEVIIDWARDLGGDIGKQYTHDSIPWCALFANHCLAVSGHKGTGSLWALDFAGQWPSVRLKGPAVGAFAPMLRDGGGHIIQIVGRAHNGNYMGLGGNQHDAVNVAEFAPTRLNKGFWWPSDAPLPLIGFSTLPLVKSDGKISSNEA